MRIVLHIGAWKTGSTAVQNFLSENVEALAERGLRIPSIAMTSSGRAKMRRSLASFDARDTRPVVDEIRSLETSSFPATTVLSCEHFWQMPESEITRTRKALSTVSNDVRVVLYVRPQYDLWRTLYAQQAKSLQVAPDAAKWGTADFVSQRHLDHALFFHRCLTKYANAFGRENVSGRLYDRRAFPDGDVALDFMSYLCTDAAGLKRTGNPSNLSLGWKGVALSLWIVGRLNLHQESVPARENWRKAYRRTIRQISTETGDGDWLGKAVDVLTPEDKADIHRYYAKDNDLMFNEYFGGKIGFERPGEGGGDSVDYRDIPNAEFERACALLRLKGALCGLTDDQLASLPSFGPAHLKPSLTKRMMARTPFIRRSK